MPPIRFSVQIAPNHKPLVVETADNASPQQITEALRSAVNDATGEDLPPSLFSAATRELFQSLDACQKGCFLPSPP